MARTVNDIVIDAPASTVMAVIADFTDFNIITSDSVQGNLTLRLKDVPWDQALQIIVDAKGLGMRKTGTVLWIAPTDEMMSEGTRTTKPRRPSWPRRRPRWPRA